jgi:opacity protein-like surface antigen
MKKILSLAALLLLAAPPLAAQNWSFGASTGPFVFGDFYERRVRISTGEDDSTVTTLVLSAGTRAGLALDLERRLADRWAVRIEGTFTRAPLVLKPEGSGEGAELDQGQLDVATLMVPLIFRINPNGTFRFHLMGGPATAIYRGEAPENAAGARPVFEGTRQEWGVAFGGGAGWWISDRFAVEANLTDIITSSPFDRDDLPNVPGITIERTQNVHTTLGVRWKF